MKRIDVGGLSALAGTWPPTGGRPTLLFIHGSGGAAALWQHQVDALAHRANTLAVDLPGHGLSSGSGISSVSDYAQVIAELVVSAGLSRVVCCGLSRLGEIAAPVLVVSSADDALTPPKYADYLGQHLTGAHRVHIDGAGHLTPMEQPERFNAAIEVFLETQVRWP
jgi:pimeloyl-ACP methyl ester carboxylesterase